MTREEAIKKAAVSAIHELEHINGMIQRGENLKENYGEKGLEMVINALYSLLDYNNFGY